MSNPLGNGSNGRDGKGRFLVGNPGGPGNPHTKRVGELRSRFYKCITDADLDDVVHKCIALAKAGDVACMKLLFAYGLGRAPESDIDVREAPQRDLRSLLTEAELDVLDALSTKVDSN